MVDTVTTQVLVTIVNVGRSLEGVRTRLCDGVDTTTDEVGLTHIERCNNHLYFLDGIERDGVTTTRQLVAQTEVIIEVGTIDGEVRGTTVTTSKAHAIGVW